ncbi:MAG: hypothetical protein PHE47_01070 [Oscillospiraceae bacterium]|nr:hypothetical protein [Oscillospiraceae bacterium]
MEKPSPMNKQKRKNKYALPLGGVFLVLAVIGLISVAGFCIRLTNQIMDNTREKNQFEDYLLPVVMFDPVEFDSPETADPLFLLQSSLWGTLLSNPNKYTYDESAMLVVPASDLDVYAAKFYGSNVKLQHQTIEDFDVTYPYDPETKTYGVPVTGQTSQYTPAVTKIAKKGDLYTLTVGYIPPGTLWEAAVGGSNYEPEPDKYMIYQLKKVKDGYNILAIKSLDTWNAEQQSGAEVEVGTPSITTQDMEAIT